jgi:hypothetical protein
MSVRQDESGVSEIVGALMLVVVVSSAAFGFGIFLHQQAKVTQAQKAADQERKLEALDLLAISPVSTDFADAGCTLDAGEADWNALSITIASRHLHESTLTQLSVNGLVAKTVRVGATTYDFSLPPTDPGYASLVVPARATVTLILDNVADDEAGCTPAYSFFAGAPLASAPLPTTGGLDVQVVTVLGNHLEKAFLPPTATASLEPTPGAAGTYVLVGSGSQAGSEGAFLVRWDWEVWHSAACGADGTGMSVLHGHRVQVTGLVAGDDYCARLKVVDNDGLGAQAELQFQA